GQLRSDVLGAAASGPAAPAPAATAPAAPAPAATAPAATALAATGAEPWLLPVALLLLAGGVWLRGRVDRARARHVDASTTVLPRQRGATDAS
ncbi:hypothetical protein, partial [Cellulomonas sp.]|uniref:hypothetical protein n=1 Tax=Cellulomonas sp. TaxID=40001 RepID=UPI002810AB32